ncbi:tyrosine-type recombinase/integrase [Fluviispira multicolorata]|uniref:Tyrosine-type recombinase/integrase n=1 Tax=Fluviispira multicolorata TaxID=2654512 RepID=A0A833JFZ9_9BACT|nr:tyrosine-type recombinase/integrase [Fluviispira multicolorata]KAB8033605.1 tyrosine-type recombinase/integrase [Fluviispira multicolorata]
MKTNEILDKFFHYLKIKGSSKHTLKAYKLDLQDYLKHLSEEHINEKDLSNLFINATSVEFKTYKFYLGASSPATVKRKFMTLKRFLDWCVQEGYRKQKLPEAIKLPKFQTLSPRWLTRNEMNSIQRALETKRNLRDKTIVNLLYHTGIRVGELVSLRWEDIDTGRYQGTLRIRKGKGEKERLVPLNATARNLLQKYEESLVKREDYLFYGIRKNPLNEDGVLRMFYSLSKQAGVKVTPHALRHTFCKNLLESNVSIDKIATLAGHSSLTVTQKYTTPSLQDLSKAVVHLED